jgi:glycosyltransferase involved in cell wall biosynthesis
VFPERIDMKIAYIAAGAGEMYCGMCIRDSALAAALIAAGHEVTLLPTYTPLHTDDRDVSDSRLFFGGINVYLQQKSAVFRHTPWLVDRLLNWPKLVRWAAKVNTKTDPELLGSLTASMLAGEDGRLRKELAKLVEALKTTIQPDLVQLSTVLLVGAARQIKAELDVPVLVGLQGEDIFLDGLPDAHRDQCLALLSERAADADGFLSISTYYAKVAAKRYGIDRERIIAVPSGINLEGYTAAPPPPEVFTVGFLARICPEKGLHVLVEAVQLLRRSAEGRRCRLLVAGWLAPQERDYLDEVRAKVAEYGFEHDFEFVGTVDRAEKIRFLQRLTVFSVPTVYRDPRGLCVLEALAAGVPAVQPRHGVFPELMSATGGVLLVNPDDPADLAAGLARFMDEPELRYELSEKGSKAVREHFSADAMAKATLDAYRRYVDDG